MRYGLFTKDMKDWTEGVPLAVIAAAIDDESEVKAVMSCLKEMWRRIYEK